MGNQIEFFAHRGFSSRAPENTLAAFRLAAQLPIAGIELDVQLTKDNKVIVIHDEMVDRVTNGRGFVKDSTYEELSKLDAGSWSSKEYAGERLPLLEEVFELYKDNSLKIIIELKTAAIEYKGIEEEVNRLIEHCNMVDRVIVSSFNHYSLKSIKRINPKIKTGILTGEVLYEPANYLNQLGAEMVFGSINAINYEMIQYLEKSDKKLTIYTVDRESDFLRLTAMGIKSIITNKPDSFLNGKYEAII